jgi:hypothetical protein
MRQVRSAEVHHLLATGGGGSGFLIWSRRPCGRAVRVRLNLRGVVSPHAVEITRRQTVAAIGWAIVSCAWWGRHPGDAEEILKQRVARSGRVGGLASRCRRDEIPVAGEPALAHHAAGFACAFGWNVGRGTHERSGKSTPVRRRDRRTVRARFHAGGVRTGSRNVGPLRLTEPAISFRRVGSPLRATLAHGPIGRTLIEAHHGVGRFLGRLGLLEREKRPLL